jgi:L-lysine 2,3-aminomutase
MTLMRDSPETWQDILVNGFSSAEKLLNFLDLSSEAYSFSAEKEFITRVPLGFAKRMETGNRRDPLLLQVLAIQAEMESFPDFVKDPVSESSFNHIPGLIHKYHGRVLLTVTGSCAINCRFCFRRHFPYQDNNPGRAGWRRALEYIESNSSINEVILSGGDPLLASDSLLSSLFNSLEKIPHVETIRIHSRIPIVLPERICEGLLSILKASRCQIVVVLHSNHPNEIDCNVGLAVAKLQAVGCYLLNQSVLLRGVNDNPDVLQRLSKALFSCKVLPYYLHLLDKVQGARHFDVPFEEALDIFKILQSKLPGYLVPRLVREEPGRQNKTLCSIEKSFVESK